MSWKQYVGRIAKGSSQVEIAAAAQVTGPTVSRWMSEKQGVDPIAAANFARAYKRPVLEAFVAAGFLTPAEAAVRPAGAPDFSQLTNDELLELVRTRMREEGEGHDRPAATNGPGSGPGTPGLKVVKDAARDVGVPFKGDPKHLD